MHQKKDFQSKKSIPRNLQIIILKFLWSFSFQDIRYTFPPHQSSSMATQEELKAKDEEIKKIVEQLNSLTAKENEVQSPKSGVEQVEKNVLLRRIRSEKRDANKALGEKL